MRKKFEIPKGNKCRCLAAAGMMSCIYLSDSMPISFFKDSLFIYFIKPVLWLGLAWIVCLFPGTRPAGKIRLRNMVNSAAFICAGIYVMLQVFGGFIDGFGRSPYSFTLKAVVVNTLFWSSALLGTELVRAYLVNNLTGRRPYTAIGVITLFFSIITTNINIPQLLSMKGGLEAVRYVGSMVIPNFCENMMETCLAYISGPVPSIIYSGTLEAFRWLCPVLPDLGVIAKTFIGSIAPLSGMAIVQWICSQESGDVKRADIKKDNPAGWIFTAMISVMIIWFAQGIFPIYPSVIATGSMEPMIKPGDLVIVKKIDGSKANVGDVVQYRLENIFVTHRVIAKNGGDGKKIEYMTKGDANSIEDKEPVSEQQIKGRVICVIPRIGWATLFFRANGGDSISPEGINM